MGLKYFKSNIIRSTLSFTLNNLKAFSLYVMHATYSHILTYKECYLYDGVQTGLSLNTSMTGWRGRAERWESGYWVKTTELDGG